jgi:hypothetical protein
MALVCMRPELGLTRTDAWLRAELGDSLRTRFATIYYHAPGTDSVSLWRAANLADFYIAEHARALSIAENRIERVAIYLYSSPGEEKRLVGTSSAAFTKPWAAKLHMTFAGVRSALRHELAHVMLARYGNALGVSISQGMLEGSAMALENDYGWRTLHQYAKILYRYGLAPSPAALMSIGGFSSRRSSVAYVVTGSFSKWLIETRGMAPYLKAFPWGDFDGAYGRSLDDLAKEYRGFLDTLTARTGPYAGDGPTDTTLVEAATARHLFGGGSFFFQKCLRRIGTLNARGFDAVAEGRYGQALEAFRASLDEGINYGARSGIIRSLSGLGRFRELLDSMAAYALDTASYPLLPYLIDGGDAWWALGDTARARRVYDSVTRLDINRELTTRAALRLYFLGAPDTLRDIMRGYFTRQMRAMQRVTLLTLALDRASAPEDRMVLTLLRASLTADESPLLTLAGIVPAMMLPPYEPLATGRGKLWGARSPLERFVVSSLAERLRDASMYAWRLRPAGGTNRIDEIGVAGFLAEISDVVGDPAGAGAYEQERWDEDARFTAYLDEHSILP